MREPTRHEQGSVRWCCGKRGCGVGRRRRRLRDVPSAAGRFLSGFTLGMVLLCSAAARADYDDYDLSLRLPAAFSNFSPYAGVTAVGNAQAASTWASSINPASGAWPHPELPYHNGISGNLLALRFQEGTDVYATTEAAILNAGNWGSLVPTAAQVRSDHGRVSTGLGFRFDAEYFEIPWGKLIAEDWALGASFNYMATETRFDLAEAPLTRTRIDDYGVRLGALHQALDVLRVGLTVDYGYAPAWTDRFDPFGRGTGTVRSMDVTQRVLARPGLVWQWAPRGNLYVDYQAGVFWNSTGTLWVHRFPVGLEYWLVPLGWVTRMGTTVDTRGNAAFTVGTGLAVSKRAFVDLAYQYGMFPELHSEFGPAQTFALSAVLGF